jgi:uncharacterized protein (TIRG00374 family)
MKRLLSLALGLLISVGALYFLVRGDIDTIQDELAGGRYIYIVPALLLTLISFVTRGLRWRALLGYRTNTLHAFNIMNVGYMLNLLPLRVGELARCYLTTRLDPPLKFFTSLSSIVVERILDLMAVMVMLGIALFFLDVPSEVRTSGAVIGVLTIVGAVVLLYFAHNRGAAHRLLDFILRHVKFLARFNLTDWLDNLLDGLQPLTSPRARAEAIFWTAISWLLSLAVTFLLIRVILDDTSLAAATLMIVLLALAVAIPSVPGNLGTFEAAGVGALWIAGVIASVDAPDNAPAVAISLLLHAISIGFYVVLGMIGLWLEQTSLGQVRAGVAHVNEEAPEAVSQPT